MFNANSRDEIRSFLEKDNHTRYVYELPTGTGKTFFAILKMKQWKQSMGGKFLVVIPKLVLIDNWKVEFKKFGADDLLNDVTFTTYISLQKHADKEWTCICFDEIHHLSDRCKEIFQTMCYKCFIGLSATLKREVRDYLRYNISGLEWVRMSLKEAIDNEVLPNPRIILIPMWLDGKAITEIFVKHPKAKKSLEVSYKDRFKCNNQNIKYNVHCTQTEWYEMIQHNIKWAENYCTTFVYLNQCGLRLKWLSDKKTGFVKEILRRLPGHRTITFCHSIEQSRQLGLNSINSKDGVAQEVLDKFNNKEINKVTCVGILNEGVNVSDCKIGVFANLNSSELITKQRTGRILRHEHPVIIIPYFVKTRDEELVQKMVLNYDPNMVVTITNLDELKNHLK